ncbi:MAG: hypothetical protein KAU95_02260, partial [Candidatus Aenigmarchaeota archaeon]|nr:hypothetical protein [Candidatus Aenigmarchaeota archaeon]
MGDIFDFLEDYGGAPPSGNGKYLGKLVCVPPLGQDENFNFTLPKGKGTDLWTGFLVALEKNGYQIQKINENLEISPVDSGYYGLTQRQKDEMEARIKQGLGSVAGAVSDYEMISHDVRKYKEFLKMFETKDEHSTRAVFIDDVDLNTGQNAMKSMVARWPTIIADFMTLGEKIPDEIEVNEIKDKLKISKAEAVILSTKQRLYKSWKELFGSEVKGRLSRLIAQQNSRKTTIEEYRNWLKPLVARHKLYKEGLSSSDTIKKTLSSQWHSPGQAFSTNNISIWAWQPMSAIEPRAGTLEISKTLNFGIEPYDDFTKEKIVFDEERGLANMYPWLNIKDENGEREEKCYNWVNTAAKDIKKEWLSKTFLYYVLVKIEYERTVIRTSAGAEMEDITIKTQNWFLSQNALLVILLKIKADQEVFDREINQLIGVTG